jgi:hypothetical protein
MRGYGQFCPVALGAEVFAERFAAERRSTPGVLLRLIPDSPRVWDLSGILPR